MGLKGDVTVWGHILDVWYVLYEFILDHQADTSSTNNKYVQNIPYVHYKSPDCHIPPQAPFDDIPVYSEVTVGQWGGLRQNMLTHSA